MPDQAFIRSACTLSDMATTTISTTAPHQETLNEAVARRTRGQFAEYRISASSVARTIGMTQAAISRRTIGMVEFSLNEVEAIAEAADLDLGYLLTGIPTPGWVRARQDSNLRPEDYQFDASVIDLAAERRVRRPDIDPLSPVRRTADVLLFRPAVVAAQLREAS